MVSAFVNNLFYINNSLSYKKEVGTVFLLFRPLIFLYGALDRARTYDPQNRNLILYPTELRAHSLFIIIDSMIFSKSFFRFSLYCSIESDIK